MKPSRKPRQPDLKHSGTSKHSPGYEQSALDALARMDEKSLQAQIIEPLLREMGYSHVRDVSGPDEKGKDLVAAKEEFGKHKLYAIQIKKIQFSGRSASPHSLTGLLVQLRQALLEPVIDPMTSELRVPDRSLFITPYAINRRILESAISQIRELERREITIVDGPLLVDQILKYIPDALTNLSVELQYRVHVALLVDRILESKAFGLSSDLSLDAIYVELTASYAKSLLGFAGGRRKAIRSIVAATSKEVTTLRRLSREWLGSTNLIIVPPINPVSLRNEKRIIARRRDEKKSNLLLADIDIQPMVDYLRDVVREYLEESKSLSESNLTTLSINAIVRRGIETQAKCEHLSALKIFQTRWRKVTTPTQQAGANLEAAQVPAGLLEVIEYPVLLTGEPGSGKTTLLRRLVQVLARRGNRLPVLVYLSRFRDFKLPYIIAQCLTELANLGFHCSRDLFEQGLEEGKYHVFFDGLDEAGSLAIDLWKSIQKFARAYPSCPLVVSCRDTLLLPTWGKAFRFQMDRLSDQQIASFVDRWFSSEPSNKAVLMDWLGVNPAMKKAARTPVVLALLCSLQNAHAEMPATEIELYEGRFDLLLGRWEQAKGIAPLPMQVRRRYWHFLMALAYLAHSGERRSLPYSRALAVAERNRAKGFHPDADALLLDCIQRGILLREVTGDISFGHLTYQEFLTGRWLANQNAVEVIWHSLEKPWWRKVLDYYAAIKEDLTQLLIFASRHPRVAEKYLVIRALLELAPFTSKEVSAQYSSLGTRVEVAPETGHRLQTIYRTRKLR